MKISKILAVVLPLFLVANSMMAQIDFIDATTFMDVYKNNKELVVIDANKTKNYQASHVKNAIHINHNDLYQKGDIKGLIMSPEELAAFFGKNGVSETSNVVVYDDGSHKYASRVYWVLKYIGAQDVKILHKDMDAWRKARVPLTSAPVSLSAVEFTTNVDTDLLATLDYVTERKDLPEVVLVDVRTKAEFDGEKNSDGHIPGAINLNYEDLLTDTGAFKPKAELEEIAAKYGLTENKELLFYCRTSVRATVSYVAFVNILNYKNVKVFDGAYLEWAANYPVE